jgi:hypothetical protein
VAGFSEASADKTADKRSQTSLSEILTSLLYGERGKTRAEALEKAEEEKARWERAVSTATPRTKLWPNSSPSSLPTNKHDGGVAPSTYQDYRYHVESHIVPLLGRVTLSALDPRGVDAFTRAPYGEMPRVPNPAAFLFGVAPSPAVRRRLEVHPGEPGVLPYRGFGRMA